MARTETYTCDVCSAVKQPSNGWWIAMVSVMGRITAEPWTRGAGDEGIKHICGETCMAKLVTQHMAKWKESQKRGRHERETDTF